MKNDKAESEMKVKEEQFLHGIGVSSEITIGTAHVIQWVSSRRCGDRNQQKKFT